MTVSTGTAPDPVTKTTYTYFRGMNGDTLPGGQTRSVTITDSRHDPAVTDSNQFAGLTYETQVFNGPATVTDTITDPWSSAATATHALTGGLPAQQAFLTGTADQKVYTPLASGATRETETDYTHDSDGRVTKANDLGDVSTSADDLCTTTSYADNTTAWILDAPSEVKTVSVNCSTTPSLPANAVSDQLSFYDGSTTLGAAPTVGDLTMTQMAASYTGSTPSYATMQTAAYDEYGRPLTATDADNRKTTTAYMPATGAEPTSVTVTDPMSQVTTTAYDPLRELPTKITTAAGYVTTEQYDALGRLTAVYKPGEASPARRTSGTPTPSRRPAPRRSTPTPSTTTAPPGCRRPSTTRCCAPGKPRPRPPTTGGRSPTPCTTPTGGYQRPPTPTTTKTGIGDPGPGPGRPGPLRDRLHLRPGRTADRRDRLRPGHPDLADHHQLRRELHHHHPPARRHANHHRHRRPRPHHRPDPVPRRAARRLPSTTRPPTTPTPPTPTTQTVRKPPQTDPAGNTWSWTYNLLGYQTQAIDPDTGTTTSTYDNAGQLLTSTDARGKQITTTYDADRRDRDLRHHQHPGTVRRPTSWPAGSTTH